MRSGVRIALAAALLLGCGASGLTRAAAQPESLYAVGNSLTLDCCGNSAIAAFARSAGASLAYAEHIRLGSSLDAITSAPRDALNAPGTTWDVILPSRHWSVLMLEPYPSPISTLDSDVSACITLIDAARTSLSPDVRVLVYAAWPARSSLAGFPDFASYWTQRVVDAPTTATVLARQYYDHLIARLRSHYGTAVAIDLVPVGDVFARLDTLLRAGAVPGVHEVADLYRDDLHLGDAGRFAAGATVYAVLYGSDPAPLAVPGTYIQRYPGEPLTPELQALAANAAWAVVSELRSPPAPVPPAASSGGSGAFDVVSAITLLLGLAMRVAYRARRSALRPRTPRCA